MNDLAFISVIAAAASMRRNRKLERNDMPPGQIQGRPPNYDAILAVFPMASRRETIFAYAPDIYVPSGKPLSEALVAHESIHIERQLAYRGDFGRAGVEAWWDKYLGNIEFRYEEEVLAHRAEYQHMIQNATCRQMRRSALKQVATRLASQLYGGLVSKQQAMEAISG